MYICGSQVQRSLDRVANFMNKWSLFVAFSGLCLRRNGLRTPEAAAAAVTEEATGVHKVDCYNSLHASKPGAQYTRFTSPKVQILIPEANGRNGGGLKSRPLEVLATRFQESLPLSASRSFSANYPPGRDNPPPAFPL